VILLNLIPYKDSNLSNNGSILFLIRVTVFANESLCTSKELRFCLIANLPFPLFIVSNNKGLDKVSNIVFIFS